VVAAGQGRRGDKGELIPLDVKEGDTILFGKYSGTEIKIEGKEYLIMREDEVLGVVEGVRELAGV
jgi:chaperonin GroES